MLNFNTESQLENLIIKYIEKMVKYTSGEKL